MARYICERCSNIYEENNGDPWFGISPNTSFEFLPDDWICCDCGSGKENFIKITDQDKVLGIFLNFVE